MPVLSRTWMVLAAVATGAAAVAAGAQLDLGRDAPSSEVVAQRSQVDRTSGSGGAAARTSADVNGRAAHNFYFTRGIYTGRGWGWRSSRVWATDFPEAEQHFLVMLQHLTNVDAYPHENPVALTDPELRRFPFLYILEVGYMNMTDEEVTALRDYLRAGGFLMIDDFHGTAEWNNFEQEMLRVFPDYPIVDIPPGHPIFSSVYQLDEIVQVPEGGRTLRGGPTHERDGFTPQVRGIFDENGRLLVGINWNTDLGDGWEWADHPLYPVRYSTFAFQIGINFVVYAMTN